MKLSFYFQHINNIPSDPKFIESYLSLNNQIETNKKNLEKIYTEVEVDEIRRNKVFDEDEVYQVGKNQEFGGCSSRMVKFILTYISI